MSSGTQAARGVMGWAERERPRWAEIIRSPAAPWIALAVMLVGTGGLLMHETRGTTIWLDEWTWLLHRRGDSLSTFLVSHDGHLSVVPIAIYRLLWATFGLRHSWPYRALMIAEHMAICVLVFVYARRRVSALMALVASAVILLFGAGWEDLLWSFQITWNTSLLAGIGALLALDRRDRTGDIAACGLLIVSLASSGIGVAILVGATLETVLVRWRARREWWVVVVPIGLYVLWAVGYQSTIITRDAFVAAPGFVLTGLASTFAGLAGLEGATGLDGPGTLMTWGPVLLIAAVALAAWRLTRLPAVMPRLLSLAVILLAFWVSTALTRYVFADPYSSRYLYVSALFVVLLAVELARGAQPGHWAQGAVAVLAGVAILSGFGTLRDAGRLMRSIGASTRADLGAAAIGRSVLPSGYILHDIPAWPLVIVPARAYFAAADQLGTPAASAGEIPTLPETAREAADRELIAIHQLSLRPALTGVAAGAAPVVDLAFAGTASVRGSCVTFTPNGFTQTGEFSPYISLTVPSAGFLLRASGGPETVGIRRFAYVFQPLGTLAADSPSTLRISPDSSSQPWHVQLTPDGRTTACGL